MLIIDRFEGDMAVIECGDKTFNLPRKLLPSVAKEGDVLKVTIDKKKTKERRVKIESLVEDAFE